MIKESDYPNTQEINYTLESCLPKHRYKLSDLDDKVGAYIRERWVVLHTLHDEHNSLVKKTETWRVINRAVNTSKTEEDV